MNSTFYLEQQKKMAGNGWYRRFWVFWGLYSVGIVLALCAYFVAKGQDKTIILAFAAFILARLVVSPIIYLFYKRIRPYQPLNFIPYHSWFFSPITKKHSSFPSDHAISLAAIAAVLAYFNPAVTIWLIILCVLNGWARVVLGYHYVWDIIAGWVLGILAAMCVIYWLAPLLFK